MEDYQGMLEDLRAMRKRIRDYNGSFHYGFAIAETELLMDAWDFMQDIQELLTSEESYRRG